MKKSIVLMAMLFIAATAFGQNTYKAFIKDSKSNDILPGTTVKVIGSALASIADNTGLVVVNNIPSGRQVIQFSYVGFTTRTDTLIFPLGADTILNIMLSPLTDDKLDEVVISATRSSRTIDNIPTRVEVIAGEELDEKSNMKPGDIRLLLAESTGIQTQQTSATSGNSAIRIQGLDGKYTQILRDGFPLYSGFSGGLGLLQVAPLDLQQVEVIKGSSSTLYGGGAIAGLVNLVSKKPTEDRQLNLLLNGTSALGLDASAFYAQKFNKLGVTVYGAYNHGTAFDPSGTGFTAIPKYDRYTLNPRLFIYLNEKTTLITGLNATTEKRIGGDIQYIQDKGNGSNTYFELNKTDRFSTQVEMEHRLSDGERLTVRNSLSYYDRTIGLPGYQFSGDQVSSFTEANYARNGAKADWVIGLNFLTDQFREDPSTGETARDYHYTTLGGFIQNTWAATNRFSIESGIRGDYHNEFGFFFLPRLSALWKINDHLSSRLGGGLGYKAPTIFTEDAERIQFRGVLPLDVAGTKAERSYGANYDLNYRTTLFNNTLGFSINHMFFYTRIDNPVLLVPSVGANYQYVQPEDHFDTQGMESNVKLTYADFKLFVGYTYADVNQHSTKGKTPYPLVSKHRLNNVLMYEMEDRWKIGAEAYYFSPQQLNDGSTGRGYWTAGLMAERIWERFSLFINFENFTDTRQTKFGPIYSGPISSPVFQDIYAPVDGFVMNGGIKVKL